MEPLRLSIPGPAYIVVPLSEDPALRLLFNDVVDFTRRGKPIDSIEDLERTYELVNSLIDFLVEDDLLSQTMLPDPEDPASREVYHQFHTKLFNAFTANATNWN